jgi:phosphoribosylformimino-5-aminoimidazole carboxamide ribotide isomerase
MFLVIPAIDLRGGRCVRLTQGKYEEETVYYDDPVKMAKLWRVQNCKVLHVVDLDAALGQGVNNRAIIRRITETLDIPVQVGGGIRTMADIDDALACGVYRVILGTAAVKDPDLVTEAVKKHGASKIVVGIDARDGEAKVQGWTEGSGQDAVEMALDMEARGCRRIVYTDISRDGTMEGPNLEAYRRLGNALGRCRVTASGGVGSFHDLLALQDMKSIGVDSVIVGRALYEDIFPCQKTWCWNYKEEVDLDCFSSAPSRTA